MLTVRVTFTAMEFPLSWEREAECTLLSNFTLQWHSGLTLLRGAQTQSSSSSSRKRSCSRTNEVTLIRGGGMKSYLEFECCKVSCHVYTNTQLSWIFIPFENNVKDGTGLCLLCLSLCEMGGGGLLDVSDRPLQSRMVFSESLVPLTVCMPLRMWQIGSCGDVANGWRIAGWGWGPQIACQPALITCLTEGMAFL